MGGRIDSCLCGKKELLELEQTDQFVPLLLTSRVQESSLPQICSCEESTLYALMQHLKEQGCKTFAILGGSGDVRVAHQRKKLLLMYGHQVGMESRPEWDITDTSFSIEGGKQAAAKLLEAPELPDAACCLNDVVAVGALQQFRSKGIQIPQDILLTGFDGEFLSDIVYPGITTAEFDYEDFAQRMFDLLLKRIHHEPCAQITEIHPHLTIRGSTMR